MITSKQDSIITYRYESIAEMVNVTKDAVLNGVDIGTASYSGRRKEIDSSYFGPNTFPSICDVLRKGDDSLVSKAQALLDKIDSVDMDTSGSIIRRDVWGTRFSTGDYVAGSPTCFRRKVKTLDDVQPINIYMNINCAWNITSDVVLNRGIAMLAFVLKLQAERPVEMFIVHEGHCKKVCQGAIQIIPVNTKPLDLATFIPLICDAAVPRRLLRGHLDTIGYDGGYLSKDDIEVQRMMGLGPLDLYFGSIKSHSTQEDSVQWVNNQLKLVKARLEGV